ncbi:MAG: prenyltransferase [Candidatus Hydrothermales bacterium]
MDRETIKKILEVYKKNKTLILSTLGDTLWSSRVYFASKGLYLYAIIEKSKNYNNILKNNKVFFTIDRGIPDIFIQGEGEVQILGSPAEREEERALLFQKNIELIPFVKMIKELVVIKIRPTRIFLSDFRTFFKPRETIVPNEDDFKLSIQLDNFIPKWERFFKATRPFSFTATFVSCVLGALLAGEVNLFLLLVTLLGVLFIHAGVNALNDLMDYKYKVDDWLVIGASRMLQDKLLSVKEQTALVLILLLLGSIIGLILTVLRGSWVLIIGSVGVFLGFFYQVKPVGLKYRALGDLSVFLAFGPLLALGSYYVQTQEISVLPIIVSFPIGLLIIGILHGNNFRDLVEDIKAGYKTIASYLGVKGSSYYYLVLVLLSYISTIILIILKIIPWQTLIVLFTIPLAYKNIRLAFRPNYLQFGLLDVFTAKLHFSFGVLLIVGIILSRISYG